jgi:hypothetical protein
MLTRRVGAPLVGALFVLILQAQEKGQAQDLPLQNPVPTAAQKFHQAHVPQNLNPSADGLPDFIAHVQVVRMKASQRRLARVTLGQLKFLSPWRPLCVPVKRVNSGTVTLSETHHWWRLASLFFHVWGSRWRCITATISKSPPRT